MKIFGLMVVRNEADILTVNLQHHFSAGVDRILVVDNGSTDGTAEVLETFAREGRLTWRRDAGSYRQAQLTTELAREAHRRGADWVLPIDADEFWYCPGGSLRDVLARTEAGALGVHVINFVQRRDQLVSTPSALLHATYRTAVPIGPLEAVQRHVEEQTHGFVELMYQPKRISRASAVIDIRIGNHHVANVPGPLAKTDEIVCLHVPLRSREALEGKVEHGARLAALGLEPVQGWHVRRWSRLKTEGRLDAEWLANSYTDGALDVYGTRHPLVFDPQLRNLLWRWLDSDAASGASRDARVLALDLHRLQLTVHRQLQVSLARETALRAQLRDDTAARDERIGALQQELFDKVNEANRIINELHTEMNTKIAEANAVIGELQARTQAGRTAPAKPFAHPDAAQRGAEPETPVTGKT